MITEKKIHFIGIGGIGISATAQFCLKKKKAISGSNQGENNIFHLLETLGMERGKNLFSTHDPKNIPKDCDLVIYTEAIPPDNVEILEAQAQKIPLKTYAEFLGEITQNYRTIAVAGTHGKTTTTGLIATALLETKINPTIIVGALIPNLNHRNFHLGSSQWCVVEACEYRDNFRFLHPEIVVITNMELDHTDFFKSESSYVQAFQRLCQKAKIVIYHESKKEGPDLRNQCLKNFTGQTIKIPQNFSQKIPLQIMGDHNQKNAQLALACGEILEKESSDKRFQENLKIGLKNFQGAERRQTLIWEGAKENKELKIFDDYGHHPTEIKVTLEAFRQQFPEASINLIFEPHQFSRTKLFFEDFVSTLSQADQIGLYPIYAARDTEIEKKSVSIEDLAKAISEQNKSCRVVQDQTDIQKFLDEILKKNLDKVVIFVFMGAGKISDVAQKFIKTL